MSIKTIKKKVKKGSPAKIHKKLNQGFKTVKLYGNSTLEYYYVNAFVGTPPQRQSLILDTGSSLTAFPCEKCKEGNCGKHSEPFFNTKASSTYKIFKKGEKFSSYQCYDTSQQNICKFSISYTEDYKNSLWGENFTDKVQFGLKLDDDSSPGPHQDLNPITMLMGCTMNEPPMFKTQYANGIMGISTLSDSEFSPPNLIDLLAQKQPNFNNRKSFSICLGNNGGHFTLGGFNKNKHDKKSLVQKIDFFGSYLVHLNGVYINGYKKYNAMKKKSIELHFDSGTTYIWLPKEILDNMVGFIKKWCKGGKKRCIGEKKWTNQVFCFRSGHNYDSKEVQSIINSYPPVLFDLGTHKRGKMVLYPSEYLVGYPNKAGKGCQVCSAFREARMGNFLIGAEFMKHKDLNFDRDKKIITFVKANCDDKVKMNSMRAVIKNLKKVSSSQIAGATALIGFALFAGLSLVFKFKKRKDKRVSSEGDESEFELVNTP